MLRRQVRAATPSEVMGQSVPFGVACNGGPCRAAPTARGAATRCEHAPGYATDRGPQWAPDEALDLGAGGLTR